MAARLLRCTTLWGTAERFAGAPGLRRFERALYLPVAEGAHWGLFADGQRLGEAGRDADPGEALPDPAETEAETEAEAKEGPFLYIGPLATHYGHFLLSTLPRLWPLLTWDGPLPRLLCHRAGPPDSWLGFAFLEAVLARLGRAPEDIVTFDRPLALRDVIVPEPSLREQIGQHDAYGELCRAIGRPFWREAETDTVARPLYLSKTRLGAGIGRIVNEAAIEEALERRGVEIAYPETLTLPEQVRLLSSRRIVTGSVGSAFHTAAFAAPGRRIVGLNWQAALNANFAMLDAVNGARARYYHPHGTTYAQAEGWGVAWTVRDPAGVAEALLRRAEWLDRGEPDDEGAMATLRRGLLRPLRRLRGRR